MDKKSRTISNLRRRSMGKVLRARLKAPALAAAIMMNLLAYGGANAAAITISDTPLYLTSSVKPNVLVLYDNSQSMDATMSGKLIAGDDPSTRGNIARDVIRTVITNNRGPFNWGVGAFNISGNGRYNTYAYFFGSDAEVVYTNDCIGGISASNGGLRCMTNPAPANGFNFITYGKSGDDPSINDVLYTPSVFAQAYGIGVNGSTDYNMWFSRAATTGWNPGDFTGGSQYWTFTPTDAGYLPATPPDRRILYVPRAWGYYANINGAGRIHEEVKADSTAHYNAMMDLLAPETDNIMSAEIKNAALFTPLAGTLKTAQDYFRGALGGGVNSPITQTCQKNFVLMATDGNPTGRSDGSMYSLAQQTNTFDTGTGLWNFGVASTDVFARVDALRSTVFGGNTYDIKTYVVGMGSTLNNPASIATLDEAAKRGGTNSAYLATNAADLLTAFNSVASSIMQQTSAASAVAVNSGSWNSGSQLFQGRFSSVDWSGQLLSYSINSSGAIATLPNWDAGYLLNSKNWDTQRNIITYKPSASLGSRGVPFRWPVNPAAPSATEIDVGMSSLLDANASAVTDGHGANRLAYLRGNTTLEDRNCNTCTPKFRDRATSVLGDVVDSAPYYVLGPQHVYRDNIETVPYSTYAATRRAQTPVIFVGANDGMLHAFNATNGQEMFAYVPYGVRNRLSTLTDTAYSHKYSTNGSPVVGDVFYDSAWRSTLVSAYGVGAKGLFALDVSNPAAINETTASSLARWEIDGTDGDVGFITSKPAIVKMRDGSYRAIIANGYNSTNGKAVLLLVDIKTGAITKIDTLAGSSTNKNGLSGIAAVSKTNNGIVDYVYAGDLYGNVWKFDLTSSSASSWGVAYGTAGDPDPLFTTASNQPITARVDVTVTPQGNYMVSFGTGQYLATTDTSTTHSQRLYGIIDAGAVVTQSQLQQQAVKATQADGTGSGAGTYRVSTNAVGTAADGYNASGDNAISLANYITNKRGWFMDLPSSGERVVSEASIRYGRATFSTLIPSNAACSYGGSGWIMEVDSFTGNRTLSFDVSGNGAVNTSDYVLGRAPTGFQINAIPSAATTIQTGNHATDVKFVNTTAGTLVGILEKGVNRTSQRSSWEQIK